MLLSGHDEDEPIGGSGVRLGCVSTMPKSVRRADPHRQAAGTHDGLG